MAHPFSNRPSFEGLNDDLFGFGAGTRLQPDAALKLHDYVDALIDQESQDSSVWSEYAGLYQEAMASLRSGDAAQVNSLIAAVFGSALTHGFAQGHIATESLRTSSAARLHVGAITLDRFYRLAEAVGAIRVQSAEHGQRSIKVGDLEEIMTRIEEAIGAELPSTSQSGSLFGLRIRDSIYSERHFDGIYGAWRASQLVRQKELVNRPSLLEIGGGAGFLAFYAKLLGFAQCAIIDLPHPAIVQYAVLASEFGAGNVEFGRTPSNGIGLINAYGPAATNFNDWSIVVNIDSLPEMPPAAAKAYLRGIESNQLFLSINQESAIPNGESPQNVVSSIALETGLLRSQRNPSWLRTGYVEEVFQRN